MIIPCIDLQGGKAVQLVQGRRLKLSVDDVLGLLERFREYPILHVIDLYAALRKGEKLKLEPKDVIPQLEPYCAEFLSTFVDNEGTMQGTDLSWFRKLRRATSLPVTAAGGVRSMREVRALEKMGMNAAVGMAIYTGKLASNTTGFAKQ